MSELTSTSPVEVEEIPSSRSLACTESENKAKSGHIERLRAARKTKNPPQQEVSFLELNRRKRAAKGPNKAPAPVMPDSTEGEEAHPPESLSQMVCLILRRKHYAILYSKTADILIC